MRTDYENNQPPASPPLSDQSQAYLNWEEAPATLSNRSDQAGLFCDRRHPEWGWGRLAPPPEREKATPRHQLFLRFDNKTGKNGSGAFRAYNRDEARERLIAVPPGLRQLERSSGQPGLNPREWDLVRRAFYLAHAHQSNKLLSLSNSRTRLLPHQIEATSRVVEALRPRFLLADEVGLGKTIEAGLILKELTYSRNYQRILILTPASLCRQWLSELKTKFNEDFTLLDGPTLRRRRDPSVWSKENKILASLDFAKADGLREEILRKEWDLVIIDEAHRLRRDHSKVTRGWQLAHDLSRRCQGLLLLSATPFRGKLEELYYLIQLLDPHIFGPYHSFMARYGQGKPEGLREKLEPVILRRRKIDVGGFTKRFARTISIELSPPEREFYDATTRYVREQYDLARRQERLAIGFVMIVYQRLLDSSSPALLRALQRRLTRLETQLQRLGRLENNLTEMENGEDWAGWEEEDLEYWEEHLEDWSADDVRLTLAEKRREILALKQLVGLGRRIGRDRKLEKLKSTLSKLRKEGHRKFLIFTEFRSTQDYLSEELEDHFRVRLFHGGLSASQKEQAIDDFRGPADILICTEAGGEGRNLQWANILINYDLPWSPLKIEQRIGRLHRFGQKKDVFIINLTTKNTVGDRILEILQNKINLFESALGEADTLLGILETEFRFRRSFSEFFLGKKDESEIRREMDQAMVQARQGYAQLNNLLTPRMMDFNLEDYYQFSREERQVENDHIEQFVRDYQNYHEQNPVGFFLDWNKSAGLKPNSTGKRGSRSPKAGRRPAASGGIHQLRWRGTTRPATFRADLALNDDSLEFLAVGHPLVDEVLAGCGRGWTRQNQARVTAITLPASLRRPDHRAAEPHGSGTAASKEWFLSGLFTLDILHPHLRKEMVEVTLRLSDGKLVSHPLPEVFEGRSDLEKTIAARLPEATPEDWQQWLARLLVAGDQAAMTRILAVESDFHEKIDHQLAEIRRSFRERFQEMGEKLDRLRLSLKLDPRPEIRGQITRLENRQTKLFFEQDEALRSLYGSRVGGKELELVHLLFFRYE